MSELFRQYAVERTDNDGKTWHKITRWAEGWPYMEGVDPAVDERIIEREVTEERVIYDRGRWINQ